MVRICSSFSGPFIKSHAKAEIFVDRSGEVIRLIKGEPSGLSGMIVHFRHGRCWSCLTPPASCPMRARLFSEIIPAVRFFEKDLPA